MRVDKDLFYKLFRQKLISRITQEQVNGLNFLLDSFEKYGEYWKDVRHVAYALATVMHETASSFQPVEEGYYLGGQKAKNFQKKLRYYPWFGRGYVQLTWETNYQKSNKELRRYLPKLVTDFEKRTGKKMDLTKDPSQALDPLISFGVMTLGMHDGWFRPGNDLDKYINNSKTDYVYARLIINGIPKGHKMPDKADLIASYAKKFEAILRVSTVEKPMFNEVGELPVPQVEPIEQEIPVEPIEDNFEEPTEEEKDITSQELEQQLMDEAGSSDTVNEQTKVQITDAGVKVETNKVNQELEKIAIEKPEPKNFINIIRNRLGILTGGNLTVQALKDWGEQAQFLGLSGNFWLWFGIIVAVSSAIYIFMIWYKNREEEKRNLEITNELVKANTTDYNIVKLVDKEHIDEYQKMGYKVITR